MTGVNRRDLIKGSLAAGAMLALPARAAAQDFLQDFDRAFGLAPEAPPPPPVPALPTVIEPNPAYDRKLLEIAARVGGASTGSVSIRRADRRTLVIDARDGLLTTPIERMFRSTRVPFAVGERALLGGGGQVEVVAITDDARPARLRVTL
ncbi:MAG TPA: twin-arginine translocation signal domain-containing protein, partial [Novosphingobium sp.]|nr:twin-arginine translocation signal domain-containing protein [Novosphingobium sp.]